MRKKKSRQKRVLGASIVVALLIVAGSTFAWFTSKDEVTNELSASANYGVTITEIFTPPTQWVPGETVNKNVSILNTGNIDAFVRVSLENYISLKVKDAGDDSYIAGNVDNYVELSREEVTALQAGGILVYNDGGVVAPDKQIVGTGYTPNASGWYIFRRNTQGTDTNSPEYAGYYFVAGGETESKYYAITSTAEPETGNVNATIDKTKTIDANNLTFDYSGLKAATPGKVVKVTYSSDDRGTDDDIVININLANDWNTNWQYVGDANEDYFYYKKILSKAGEASDQSELLIDSVTLDSSVKEGAYIDFDYYLTVKLDTVQTGSGTAIADQIVPAQSAWSMTATEASGLLTWKEYTTQ